MRPAIAGTPKTTRPAAVAVSVTSPAGDVATIATTYSIAKAAVPISAVGIKRRKEPRTPSDQPRVSVTPTGVTVAPMTIAFHPKPIMDRARPKPGMTATKEASQAAIRTRSR